MSHTRFFPYRYTTGPFLWSQDRMDEWWHSLGPAHREMARSCFSALGLHLAGRLDWAWSRWSRLRGKALTSPPAAMPHADAPSCEWIENVAASSAMNAPKLPEFPEIIERFEAWDMIAVPRLLPDFFQRWVQGRFRSADARGDLYLPGRGGAAAANQLGYGGGAPHLPRGGAAAANQLGYNAHGFAVGIIAGSVAVGGVLGAIALLAGCRLGSGRIGLLRVQGGRRVQGRRGRRDTVETR